MSGFDLSQQKRAAQAEDEGTFVHVHGLDDKPMYYVEQDTPDAEEKPVGITVVGAHSSKFRRFDAQLRKRRIRPKDLTGERLHEDSIDRAVHCTLDWQGFHVNGEALQPTPENVRMLYRECGWVLDQVVEAMNDHSRFFKKESSE